MLALNNNDILLLFQLIALAFEAKENLQNLGVFNEIDLMIDTSSGEELGTSALYFVFLKEVYQLDGCLWESYFLYYKYARVLKFLNSIQPSSITFTWHWK